MKASPKHDEKVATGSLTPISVPATLAVYPLMKWYIACSLFSLLTGGNRPPASQVKKIMFSGWPPTHGTFAFGIYSIGKEHLVFSVIVVFV